MLDHEQILSLLEAAEGDRFEAVYFLVATSGMRESEILGLRWRDVNLDRATAKITGSLSRLPKDAEVPEGAVFLEGRWVLMPPKTHRCRRTLPLTPEAVATLRRHQARQKEKRLAAGEMWTEHDLVFTNEIGGPVEPTGFYQRQFLPLLEKAELPRVTFHQLRHSVATMLLETGLHPAVASALLGHAQISTTLDVYSHVVPGLAAQGSSALRGLIWGNSGELSSDLSSTDADKKQEESASSSVN